jgi:hypothetical protein
MPSGPTAVAVNRLRPNASASSGNVVPFDTRIVQIPSKQACGSVVSGSNGGGEVVVGVSAVGVGVAVVAVAGGAALG